MNKLMCHVVAGYPSADECIDLMLAMQKAGVEIIEVQIPFSDPIADGPTIMKANDVALGSGMTIRNSFEMIKKARERGLTKDVYIMSYVQKLIHSGIEDFCRRAAKVDAAGLIIPDLPFDSPEYETLIKAAQKNSLRIVPVISPGIGKERLDFDLSHDSPLVYITSMKGITGNRLTVTHELAELCDSVRSLSPESVLAIGFGVQNRKDVEQVLKIADIAVVGSSVIKKINESGISGASEFIGNLVSG